MANNRKISGLLVIFVLIAAATSASTGSAGEVEEFTAEEYPAILHGEQTSPSTYTFSGRVFECEEVTVSGELTEPSENVALVNKHEQCSFSGLGLPATTSTSCGFGLAHVDNRFGETITTCLEEYTHHITMYAGGSHESAACSYEVSEAQGEGVTYTNLEEPNGIEIHYEIAEIPYTRVVGGALLCGPESGTTTYEASTFVTAENENGEPIGFDLS